MSGQKQALIAIAIVITALGFWVRSQCATRGGVDLRPRPDALEYGLTARSFAESGSLTLTIGAAEYPPRYPPGFAVLAAPFAGIEGLPRAWHAGLFHGLLCLFLTCLLGFLLDGLVAAALAGVVIALSPEGVLSSVVAMSETASMAFWAGTLLLLAVLARNRTGRPKALALLLAGLLIGAAVTVRYTNLALLLPALLFFGTRHRFTPKAPLRALLLVLVPALCGVLLVLLYNHANFGSVWRDGYRFWAPHIYDNPSILFSPRYLLNGLPGYWDTGHLEAYGKALLGLDGALLTPVVCGLTAIGVIRTIVRSRVCPVARFIALAIFTAAPAVLLFHLAYAWQSVRFLLPLLPLLAILCGSGARAVFALCARAPGRQGKLLTALVTLLLAALVAFPLARPLQDRLFPESRIRPAPPMLEVLPELDRELEVHSLVIVNFPVTLAAPALDRDREILINDGTAADPHLNFINRHGLKGLRGQTPDIRSLAIHDVVRQESLRHVMLYVNEGRPVYYVYCAGEAPGGAGIEELNKRARLVEWIARPPFTVYRVERRE